MAAQSLIDTIADRIAGVGGVSAVVLGGSRARGMHTPGSDIDLGIYYHPDRPLDLQVLAQLATEQVVILLQRPVFGSIDGSGQGFEHLPGIEVGGWLGLNSNPVAFILLEGDCCFRIQGPAIVNSGKV